MITLFESFRMAVDLELQRRYGLTSDDLPDFHYRDNFDNGISVIATVEEALENADFI